MSIKGIVGWLGLNKPNKGIIIILSFIVLLNFIAFLYVLSNFCGAPSCPEPSTLSNLLGPIVTVTYSPFYFQNKLADTIVYEKVYIDENTHTVKVKYPNTIEYSIRGIFILIAMSFYLAVSYIFSCLIYKGYNKIKISNN